LKAGSGDGRLWVRVPRLPLRRAIGRVDAPSAGTQLTTNPGTPTGRAARLKTGRLWVRIPPWVVQPPDPSGHEAVRRPGRQPADHSRSEREMLRVRIPPEPFEARRKTPSRSSLECSPPCQGGDHGFESHRGRSGINRHGTQTGKAAKLKPW